MPELITQDFWLPTRRVTTPVGIGLLSYALLIVGSVAVSYFFQTVPPHQISWRDLLVPWLVIDAIGIVIPLLTILRRPIGVGLSSSGLELVYPFRTVRLVWLDLMNVKSVGQGMLVFRTKQDHRVEFGGAYWITLEQARAILSDPRCPHVDLRDDWRLAVFPSRGFRGGASG